MDHSNRFNIETTKKYKFERYKYRPELHYQTYE